MSGVDYVVLVSYLLFLMLMGPAFRSFSRNASDFFRAGGTMVWWVAASSAFMTGFTAWSFTGGAAKAYETGFFFLVLFGSNMVAFLLMYLFFAARFRQMRVITPIEAVRKRFGPVTEQVYTWLPFPIGLVNGGIMVYILSVFTSSVFGLNLYQLVVALGVTVTVIATIGGAWAAHASDFVQMLVFLAITLVMVVASLSHPQVGGLGQLLNKLPAAHWDWTQFARPWVLAFFIGTLLINQVVQNNTLSGATAKFILVKNGRDARRVALTMMLAQIITTPMWIIPPLASTIVHPELQVLGELKPHIAQIEAETGRSVQRLEEVAQWAQAHGREDVVRLVGRARELGADLSHPMARLKNPKEGAYVAMAITTLPKGLLGLLVCGIFSATLTSMTAGFNIAAGILIRNFYLPIINPQASETRQVVLGKLVTVAYGAAVIVIGLLFARYSTLPLFDLILLIAATVGIPQAVPMFFGIFVKRAPYWSAWSTLCVGFAVALVLRLTLNDQSIQAMVQAVFPQERPLSPRELGDLNIAITTAVLMAVCTGWFFFSCLFAKYRSAAEVQAVEAFFREMNTPIDMRVERAGEHESDERQYRVLGLLSLSYGCFILLLTLIPNTVNGRLGLGFCGGMLAVVGGVLWMIARIRTASQASSGGVARPVSES